jgi:hypothetical protein
MARSSLRPRRPLNPTDARSLAAGAGTSRDRLACRERAMSAARYTTMASARYIARAVGDGVPNGRAPTSALSLVSPSVLFHGSQCDLRPREVILADAPIKAAKKWGNGGCGKVGVLDRHSVIPLRPCEGVFLGRSLHDTLPRQRLHQPPGDREASVPRVTAQPPPWFRREM